MFKNNNMSNNKNTVAIIGVLISATILLFGNNIIGRLFSSKENVKVSENPSTLKTTDTPQNKTNTTLDDEFILDEKIEKNKIQDLPQEEIGKSNRKYKEELADDFLADKYSTRFEDLIQNKKLDEALEVLNIAKSKTTQSGLLEPIENRKRSILLMMEKDFDNAWFSFPSKLVLTEKNGKQGLYSRSGHEIIKPKYDEIEPMGFYPLLLTKEGEKYGFIDKNGKEIFPPILTTVEPYYFDPLFLIEKNGKTGFINKNGKVIVEPQFSKVWGREGDLIIVKKNEKWGLIDTSGLEVVKIKFDTITEFNEDGIALAKLNGKKLFIDKTGKKVKNPAFK